MQEQNCCGSGTLCLMVAVKPVPTLRLTHHLANLAPTRSSARLKSESAVRFTLPFCLLSLLCAQWGPDVRLTGNDSSSHTSLTTCAASPPVLPVRCTSSGPTSATANTAEVYYKRNLAGNVAVEESQQPTACSSRLSGIVSPTASRLRLLTSTFSAAPAARCRSSAPAQTTWADSHRVCFVREREGVRKLGVVR